MRLVQKTASSMNRSPNDEVQPKKRKIGQLSAKPLATIMPNQVKTALAEPAPLKFAPIAEKPVVDYDQLHAKNPDSVANFAFDIFRYLKHQEGRYHLDNYFQNRATVVQEHQRALVIDWLVECQEVYSYTHETLYIAVRLFDGYMSKNSKTLTARLQLVAGTAFLLASKYEEYEPVRITDLVSLCSNLYKKEEFIKMECEVLTSAGCDLGFPVSYSFLRRYSRVIQTTMRVMTLARFILEISLHYSEFVFLSPSKVAGAALILALEKYESSSDDWGRCFAYYSGYEVEEMKYLVRQLDAKVTGFRGEHPKCTKVVEKYLDTTFYEVAKKFYD